MEILLEYVQYYDQSIVDTLLSHANEIANSISCLLNRSDLAQAKITKYDRLAPLLPKIAQRAAECGVVLDFDASDKNGDTLMYYGCTYGSIQFIRALRKVGANVNNQNCRMTPLCAAVVSQNSETVKYLLKKRADPNIDNCLFDAIVCVNDNALKFGSIDIIRLLLDSGADPNLNKVIDGYVVPIGVPCVIRSDWFDVMELMIKAGLDLSNSSNNNVAWSGLRYALERYSACYNKTRYDFNAIDVVYPKANDIIRNRTDTVCPKKFANTFFNHRVNTSLPMVNDGDTVMHIIIRMIINGWLLPSCILKLKEHDSILDITSQNDKLQTPIDLIDEAVACDKFDKCVAKLLKRELRP